MHFDLTIATTVCYLLGSSWHRSGMSVIQVMQRRLFVALKYRNVIEHLDVLDCPVRTTDLIDDRMTL